MAYKVGHSIRCPTETCKRGKIKREGMTYYERYIKKE